MSGEGTRPEKLARVLQLLVGEGRIIAGFALVRESTRLRTEAVCGFDFAPGDIGGSVEEGLLVEVADSRQPAVVDPVGAADRLPDWMRNRMGGRGLVSVPIARGRETIGVLAAVVPAGVAHRHLAPLRLTAGMMGLGFPMMGGWSPAPRFQADGTSPPASFADLIGNSGVMRHVYQQITQVAPTTATVLLRGESGTGKELIARAIHSSSPRAGKPFVSVNCAALPPTLIEAELFGAEKGAFTGAVNRRSGLFERAHGGTLFLDEIGDLDSALQVKLLRVLQEREIQRVGGTEVLPVDVRVIAATHQDLESAMADGTFREDLYYRLNVFSIFIPALRERKADVLLLANHFVEKYALEYGKPIKRISTSAIDMLASYHWPGNIRELENTMIRAVLVCDESVIHAHHLPPTLQTAEASGTVTSGSLADLVASYERDLIEDALKSTRGNRARAAELLQTTDRILAYRIRQYGIDAKRFKNEN